MTPLEENIYLAVKANLARELLAVISIQLEKEVGQMTKVIAKAGDFYKSLETESNKNQALAKYHKELYALIQTKWEGEGPLEFSNAYPNLTESLSQVFDNTEDLLVTVQGEERFLPQSGDSSFLKFVKFWKRILFSIKKAPVHLVNAFRTEKTEISYWSQKIPLRSLAKKHFYGGVVNGLCNITELLFASIVNEYKAVQKWEKSLVENKEINTEERIEELNQFKLKLLTDLEKETEVILSTVLSSFQEEYPKAGTFELPARELSEQLIQNQITDIEYKWKKNNEEWKNTIYAFIEKWRSELDINTLKYSAAFEFSIFEQAQGKKLLEHVDHEIELIQGFITSAYQEIDQEEASISSLIKKIVYRTGKNLSNNLIPELSQKLSNRNITGLINKLEIDIKNQVDLISNEHVLVENDTFDKPIAKENLQKVSLDELIKFEILTVFQNSLGEVKQRLFQTLESTLVELSDLGQIITFSLNSAISAIDNDQRTDNEAASIALEGLDRASNRLKGVGQVLEDSWNTNNQEIESAIKQFCESLEQLTNHENLKKLKLRITKAKSALESEKTKKEIKGRIEGGKNKFLLFFSNAYQGFREKLDIIGGNFILTAKDPVLTKDVSNFLLESQNAIEKLPLIYRRLYQIEPLEDLELFEGRTTEIEEFKQAFESWKNNRFATTMILAEKWGGLTTFLNYVTKKEKLPFPVKKLTIEESICQSEDFLNLLRSKFFKDDQTLSLEEIEQSFNNGGRQVIIIEDIQNLYLRKSGGFEALQTLFKLISSSYLKVFWVTTSTVYSWAYLKKAIKIEEVFSNVIEMRNFSKEQITNIIWKRNRISGFNIKFTIKDELTKDKKFSKYDTVKQQTLLKEAFFAALNDFSKSNVSLALIYWLLSTKEIDEQSITIGEFKKPNLDFLQTFSMDKIYILLALVLHEGLGIRALGEVLNLNQQTCEQSLFALQKDGILINSNGQFTINPIVYRNTISLLKAKNLIH